MVTLLSSRPLDLTLSARSTIRREEPGELRPLVQVKAWTKLEIVQAEARGLGKKDGCAALHSRFPDRSHRWFSRNFDRLMAMDVADFARELVSDPTGGIAARNVDRRISEVAGA